MANECGKAAAARQGSISSDGDAGKCCPYRVAAQEHMQPQPQDTALAPEAAAAILRAWLGHGPAPLTEKTSRPLLRALASAPAGHTAMRPVGHGAWMLFPSSSRPRTEAKVTHLQ